MSIRIGGREYKISFETEKTDNIFAENLNAYAYVSYTTSEIKIRKDISVDYKQENLLHELLHALLDNTGLQEENLDNTINILVPRIHDLLIKNPSFQKDLIEMNFK